ncbi:hypothetical protein BSKO_05329 [Bryopsis sp. KO-2023]|nr:hypothetical protein BSKO_05329 [Bryopsis sp. KO-2023]
MLSGSIVVSEGPLEGSALSRVLEEDAVELSSATICSSFMDSVRLPPSSFSSGVCLASGAGFPTQEVLNALVVALKPGAALVIHLSEGASAEGVQTACVLSGFRVPEEKSASKLTVSKPEWESGSKTTISLRKKKTPVAQSNGQNESKPNVWKISGDNDGDDDDELLDEDDLLTEEDLKPAVIADCGTKAVKKACKDCTCGRAEAEAKGEEVKLTPEMLENPQSSCGSCGLGDAFRCGTCPYRGLPAFQQGKKIELPADFLAADA